MSVGFADTFSRKVRWIASVIILLTLSTCSPSPSRPDKPPPPKPMLVAPGLVPLPCGESGPLIPHTRGYCLLQRHYVRSAPRAALKQAAAKLRARYPGASIRYMEASWPLGKRPMPPHLSHGDGREVDLTLFYTDLTDRPLAKPPTPSGYRAFEPPLRERDRRCTGATARPPNVDAPDPPTDRNWRLDEVRTAALVRILAADPRVRRVFIEPHLKARLGLAGLGKVRFAGCRAARHDDHIHVDFF